MKNDGDLYDIDPAYYEYYENTEIDAQSQREPMVEKASTQGNGENNVTEEEALAQAIENLVSYLNTKRVENEASTQGNGENNVVQEESQALAIENAISCLNTNETEHQDVPIAKILPMEQAVEDAHGMDLLATVATSLSNAEAAVHDISSSCPVVIKLEKKARNAQPDPDEAESSDPGALSVPRHLSMKLPRGYESLIGLTKEGYNRLMGDRTPENERRKPVTTLSFPFNFQLPDDHIFKTIVLIDEKELAACSSSSFRPLPQRLEGWKVKHVARSGGRIDKTFHHGEETFRSFVMVETFLVYGGRTKHFSRKRKQAEKPIVRE